MVLGTIISSNYMWVSSDVIVQGKYSVGMFLGFIVFRVNDLDM